MAKLKITLEPDIIWFDDSSGNCTKAFFFRRLFALQNEAYRIMFCRFLGKYSNVQLDSHLIIIFISFICYRPSVKWIIDHSSVKVSIFMFLNNTISPRLNTSCFQINYMQLTETRWVSRAVRVCFPTYIYHYFHCIL